MSIDIESLGFTKEDLQERVIDRICQQLLETAGMDEDGEDIAIVSPIAKRLEKSVKDLIERKVSEIAEQNVLPKVGAFVDNIMLQETNKWGEKTGKGPLTLTEYLVSRVEAYITEQVDHDGKSKSEKDSYNWS